MEIQTDISICWRYARSVQIDTRDLFIQVFSKWRSGSLQKFMNIVASSRQYVAIALVIVHNDVSLLWLSPVILFLIRWYLCCHCHGNILMTAPGCCSNAAWYTYIHICLNLTSQLGVWSLTPYYISHLGQYAGSMGSHMERSARSLTFDPRRTISFNFDISPAYFTKHLTKNFIFTSNVQTLIM